VARSRKGAADALASLATKPQPAGNEEHNATQNDEQQM
jgi:hypothetical protein